MGIATRDVVADDIAFGVNPRGTGGGGAWEIDVGEGSVLEQKAVADAANSVPADDIALRVDT